MKRINSSMVMLLVALFNFHLPKALASAPDSQPGASETTTQTTSPVTASVSAPENATSGVTPISFFDQKLPVVFGLSVGETYDDNIFIQPHKSSDFITDITPSIDLEFGTPIDLGPNIAMDNPGGNPENSPNQNYFSLAYKPTLLLYADHSKLNEVNQFVDGLYVHQFSKLTLAIEQSYAKLSQPNIQLSAAGVNVNRDVFTTTARVNYVYSDKLSTYGTFTQNVTDYQTSGFTNENDWTGDYYFLYQILPKVSIGLGPRIGFVDIQGAPNQTSQAGLLHLTYVPTGKLTFNLDAGVEVREYQNTAVGDTVAPILDATGTYTPFDSTTLTLSAGRDVHASNSFIGQDYTSSRVQLGARQRFLQMIYFNLDLGYENDSYNFAATGLGGPTRDDDYYYVKTGFDWAANSWLTLSTYYQYSEDNSNFKTISFSDNQANIAVSLKY